MIARSVFTYFNLLIQQQGHQTCSACEGRLMSRPSFIAVHKSRDGVSRQTEKQLNYLYCFHLYLLAFVCKAMHYYTAEIHITNGRFAVRRQLWHLIFNVMFLKPAVQLTSSGLGLTGTTRALFTGLMISEFNNNNNNNKLISRNS